MNDTMTTHERMSRIFAHQEPDRVPIIRVCPFSHGFSFFYVLRLDFQALYFNQIVME
jgi:hypothetical protein